MTKLENTKTNQKLFFGQYLTQKVGRIIDSTNYWPVGNPESDYLELRTPNQLEKEELMELLRFFDDRANNLIEPEWHAHKYIERIFKNDNSLSFQERICGIDWLRSKGILVPWMGLNEQDLIDYGWVKLKLNNKIK